MVVDSVELLRMIRDGVIKDKTKLTAIFDACEEEFKINCMYDRGEIYKLDEHGDIISEISSSVLIQYEFEILTKDEEIDIQAIEELERLLYVGNNAQDIKDVFNNIINKQNELIKAVKQLDKKIK